MLSNRVGMSVLPVLLVSLLGGSQVNAGDWPQYLGPNRDGTSEQQGLLRTWPEQGPEVLWTLAVGVGFGGPVVSNGKVYLLDRDDEVGDILRCLDLATGKELWRFAYDAPGSVMFPGSRSIPTVDGEHVYSCGPYGDLYCIDIKTHKPVWRANVWKDFGGGEIPRWAITQNPLVHGELLILAAQTPTTGVVAYDKLTGEVRWTTPPLGGVGYASPSLAKISGRDHVVMISASVGRDEGGGKVVGINPRSGKMLWEYTGWQCLIPIPSAVDAGQGRLLITGAYEAGAAMIKVAEKEDGSYSVTELYKTVEFGAHTKPPVLHNGYFYGLYSTNKRKDGLVCMGIDGQIRWKTKRSPLFDKGSMILADGLLLGTDGSSTLYLIDPDPSAFKPLASAELLDPGKKQNWAPMALAEGALLLRDQHQMKCVRVAR